MDTVDSKVLALFVLLILTLIFGFLPFLLIKCRVKSLGSQTYARIFDLLNAFAGGVFLGTCLLHLLAEGREEMVQAFKDYGHSTDYPVFEVITAAGFFVIVVIDSVAHSCLHSRHAIRDEERQSITANSAVDNKFGYDAIEQQPEVEITGRPRSDSTTSHVHDMSQLSNIESMTKAVLLLIALSFHTIFDGLAVGLQATSADTWQVMTAVSIHKCLVVFCLGLQLFSAYISRPCLASKLIILFSLMSPIGLAIGIGVTSGNVQEAPKLMASAVLQAVATGTFLYVTFFEILRDCLAVRRSFWNIFMAVIGFAAMAGVKVLDTD